MAAGREPVAHPPRPPIPIAAVDARAAAAVHERLAGRGLGGLAALGGWLAAIGCGDPPVLRARLVVCAEAAPPVAGIDTMVSGPGLAPARDPAREPALTVGEVAAAVDTGRDLAAAAARDGVTVLAAAVPGAASATGADCLAALLADDAACSATAPGVAAAVALHAPLARGPLGALRRVGTWQIAVACGLALGAGEHGRGLLCDGPGAVAGAAVAAAVEPDVLPRLLAAGDAPGASHAALLARVGLDPVLAVGSASHNASVARLGPDPMLALGSTAGDGTAAAAALAVLRVAAMSAG